MVRSGALGSLITLAKGNGDFLYADYADNTQSKTNSQSSLHYILPPLITRFKIFYLEIMTKKKHFFLNCPTVLVRITVALVKQHVQKGGKGVFELCFHITGHH